MTNAQRRRSLSENMPGGASFRVFCERVGVLKRDAMRF